MNQNTLERYQEMIIRLAESNETDQPARMAAGLVWKGSLVSVGTNVRKTHPFQAKYGRNSDSIYLHAEISAIKGALRHIDVDDFRRSTLLVCRLKRPSAQSKSFELAMARPCEGCMRAIADFGIGKVLFTNDDGGWSTL